MDRMPLAALAALVAFSAPVKVFAGSEDVAVEQPWARASIGVSRPGAAYMTVLNKGEEAVTLTGLSTPLAKMPEVHRSSTTAQGLSTMAPAGEITISPGESVALEPGGLHTMLMRLQTAMIEGETFSLTLAFADGGEVTVDVPILGIAARGPEG